LAFTGLSENPPLSHQQVSYAAESSASGGTPLKASHRNLLPYVRAISRQQWKVQDAEML